jgi:predicted RecB family nuclease
MQNYLLTKSRFLSGTQCHKKLWREINKSDSTHTLSLAERQRIDVGKEIGLLARLRFPGGILVSTIDTSDALKQTAEIIATNPPAIYEPSFQFNDMLVRIDILKNNNDGSWDIVEVKSGTTAKDEYITDAAIQYYCAVGAGMPIRRVHIMHVNNKCVYPNLDDFFSIVDVTADVLAIQSSIASEVGVQIGMLSNPEPAIAIGKHCDDCQYKPECWVAVPKQSIFTIPRIASKKCDELMAAGILGIVQIPGSYKFSDIQKEYVQKARNGKPRYNVPGIKSELSKLQYPLHFFDFETDNAAVPRFDGCNPYVQYPFQYSLHVLGKDGTIDHQEYLHADQSDPRRIIAERMITDLGTSGHIIVYNAGFERQVIMFLAKWYPDLATVLNALLARFWDQFPVVKSNIFHPDFLGSYSIKSVLPVLIPDLNYDQLDEVHDGTEAGAAWNIAIHELDEAKKNKTFENLKAYCRLDTMAMVRIHQYLSEIR